MKLWSIESKVDQSLYCRVWSQDCLYVPWLHAWTYLNDYLTVSTVSSYGVVVALNIVFTSHLTEKIKTKKYAHKKRKIMKEM